MNPALNIIERSLKTSIEGEINRLGIMYRMFSRIKDEGSINEKKSRKKYSVNGRKMQDIIGFRIVTYFNDDVHLLFKMLKSKFEIDNEEYDNPLNNQFEPLRKNLVCKLHSDSAKTFDELALNNDSMSLIDKSFEIQFRTTLSEGWHEVEHNMRYKCKSEWETYGHENRMMNGIYASLEASDHTLKSLFDSLAYQNYRNKKWEAMLRNKFRLRFAFQELNVDIVNILNENNEIAKTIFRMDRIELLNKISSSNLFMKFSFDNIVFLVNHLKIKNNRIYELTPTILRDQFDSNFSNIKVLS